MDEKATVDDALEMLREKGYVLYKAPVPTTSVFKAESQGGRKVRFGIVADTQLGSRYQQLTYLHSFYRLCAKRRVPVVLHAGDVVDGGHVYRGQEYEVFVQGADAQAEYAIANYPRYKGVHTYLLSGNHDASFQAQSGIDVVAMICRRRDDMTYLGYAGATVDLDGVIVYVMHADGGVPYARSYRGQKITEQFPGGEKPHVLVIGHLHITDVLPVYRNVLVILAGCFQSQTPYLRRKGLAPDIGGYIVELEVSDLGGSIDVISAKVEWRAFRIPKKDDF